MKRLLCIILIFASLLSAGCSLNISLSSEPVEVSASVQTDEAESAPGIAQDDEIYAQVEPMMDAIADFIEYNHILNNTIDYTDVSAEDFWNIVALVIKAYDVDFEYSTTDVAGVIHVKWDTMVDFAKTFLYKSWDINRVPEYKDSYAATADPGSGVMDLIPLAVDNFDYELLYIEKAPSSAEYNYILHLALKSRDAEQVIYNYEVYIADWQYYLSRAYHVSDEGDHAMPFIVTGYSFISKEELNEVQD